MYEVVCFIADASVCVYYLAGELTRRCSSCIQGTDYMVDRVIIVREFMELDVRNDGSIATVYYCLRFSANRCS